MNGPVHTEAAADRQQIQEDQYEFPYHYIPVSEHGAFRSHVYWSWGINYISALEHLASILHRDGFRNLIDVGCGDGRFLREINRRFPDRELLGIDTSDRAVMLAQALNPQIAYRVLDLFEHGLPADFDAVTLIEVLEHVPVELADGFIERIASLQPAGGRLYITVPHINRPVQKKHYQHFDPARLNPMLNPFYEIREQYFFDRKNWQLKIIRGLMRNRLFILNHPGLLSRIYAYYRKRLFFCSEAECARFGVTAVRLPVAA